MKTILWGDGVHDDTAAIQERIDEAYRELSLPDPEVCYLISRPLELPSDFRLVLPRFAEVRLAPGSNCLMLKNKTVSDRKERVTNPFWDYVNDFSDEYSSKNIEVTGGVWNFNNKNQAPNPQESRDFKPGGKSYTGIIALFFHVDGLRLSSMTFKDPVTYAVMLDAVTHFTVDHIRFDFNHGNPRATNMDGIHLDGGCRFGEICDLKGACFDDLVALNADEATSGPISDITICGIYAEGCHSAVRLLSANYPVTNVHISDVYGTYFQYCVGVSRFYETRDHGFFDGITLEKIYAGRLRQEGDLRLSPDLDPVGPSDRFAPDLRAPPPGRGKHGGNDLRGRKRRDPRSDSGPHYHRKPRRRGYAPFRQPGRRAAAFRPRSHRRRRRDPYLNIRRIRQWQKRSGIF